jgi:hypothetical protein
MLFLGKASTGRDIGPRPGPVAPLSPTNGLLFLLLRRDLDGQRAKGTGKASVMTPRTP